MTTAEAARAAGCSVQQVRRLETLGAIPAAERLPNGHRRFTETHVRALIAYRRLASAIGPVAALDTFISRSERSPADTAAVLGGFAAGLDAERTRALAVREMLVGLDAETDDGAESMTMSQLTHALGVPASTLRFWEDEGLVSPDRVARGATRARIYRPAAIREARITAELRAPGIGSRPSASSSMRCVSTARSIRPAPPSSPASKLSPAGSSTSSAQRRRSSRAADP